MLKFVLVLSMSVVLPVVSAIAGEPADAVKYFYDNLGRESEPSNRERFTGPALDFFNAADAAWQRDQTTCIEFGFPVDAQDYDETEIARTLKLEESVQGDAATVTAKFDNFGRATQIEWTLQNAAAGWLVSDIASPESAWRVSAMSCK